MRLFFLVNRTDYTFRASTSPPNDDLTTSEAPGIKALKERQAQDKKKLIDEQNKAMMDLIHQQAEEQKQIEAAQDSQMETEAREAEVAHSPPEMEERRDEFDEGTFQHFYA